MTAAPGARVVDGGRGVYRDPVDSKRKSPAGTPTSPLSPNTGPLAAAAWLAARELVPDSPRWSVRIAFDHDHRDTFEIEHEAPSTRFQLEIYAEEWGFVFRHDRKVSWIRVTDIPFVHGHDDHGLLLDAPKLRDLGAFVRRLEQRHAVVLPRHAPLIASTIPGADGVLRRWAREL